MRSSFFARVSLLAITFALFFVAGCEGSLNEKDMKYAEGEMERARTEQSCMLAASAMGTLENFAEAAAQRSFFTKITDRLEGESGWSKENNQMLIEWRKEMEEICAANPGS